MKLVYRLFLTIAKHIVLHITVSTQQQNLPSKLYSSFRYENIGVLKNLDALLACDGNTNKTDLGLGGRADINDSRHHVKFKVSPLIMLL